MFCGVIIKQYCRVKLRM